MTSVKDIVSTRYDRLNLFYDNMKSEVRKFEPVTTNCTLIPPIQVDADKNMYRKYFRIPINYSDTKQYCIKIFNKYYKLHKKDNQFYFIDTPGKESRKILEREFFTSILPSYIVVAIYELIKWLTGSRLKYRLKIVDKVFSPIFEQPQWSYPDYDCQLLITMYPVIKCDITDKTLPLSIFYSPDYLRYELC